jgi:hypothetical protein
MGQQQKHPRLGTDTFSGAGSLAGTRPLFFGKTLGQIELERSGLLKVASPISGHTLTVPDGSGPNHHAKIKDPICGTVLNLGNQACVVTPVLTQPQVRTETGSCSIACCSSMQHAALPVALYLHLHTVQQLLASVGATRSLQSQGCVCALCPAGVQQKVLPHKGH